MIHTTAGMMLAKQGTTSKTGSYQSDQASVNLPSSYTLVNYTQKFM